LCSLLLMMIGGAEARAAEPKWRVLLEPKSMRREVVREIPGAQRTVFAPVVTTLMSINLMLVSGVPFFSVGWMGRFYEPLGPTNFWWLHAGIAGSSVILALVLRPVIARLLGRDELAPHGSD
jgi:hypothetical protein